VLANACSQCVDPEPVGQQQYNNNDDASSSLSQPLMALVVTILGGLCFGFFSPAMNMAVNDPFDWSNASRRPLTVSMANLWFSLAFGCASVLGNSLLMHCPPTTTTTATAASTKMATASPSMPKTTLYEYIYGCPFQERPLALLTGLICGWANLLQFQGGNLVGFATADVVQAFPLISTIWDVVLFREFQHARHTVVFYLVAMYVMYLAGIGCLISSSSGGGGD